MEALRDIKEIVEVPDHSLALLLGLIVLTLMLLAILFYFYKNRRKRRKKLSPKEKALLTLNQIDYDNPKEVVYTFEAEVEPFLTQKNKKDFEQIKHALEPYKYKPNVPSIEPEMIEKIQRFIKGLK